MAEAAHAISGELAFDRLLPQSLKTLVAHAGAQRGSLILRDNDTPVLRASFEAEARGGSRLDRAAIEDCGERMPVNWVRFVWNTGQTLTSEHRQDRHTPLDGDPYVVRVAPKSLLVTPILLQERIIGILHLEHRTCAGLFTLPRLKVIRLLCAQAAISIEHANLYRDMEQRVFERTEALEGALDRLEAQHLDLKRVQGHLVHHEKMSSLRPLTAGIAHEINNPTCIVDTVNQNLIRDMGRFRGELLEMAGEDAPTEILDFLKRRLDGFVAPAEYRSPRLGESRETSSSVETEGPGSLEQPAPRRRAVQRRSSGPCRTWELATRTCFCLDRTEAPAGYPAGKLSDKYPR